MSLLVLLQQKNLAMLGLLNTLVASMVSIKPPRAHLSTGYYDYRAERLIFA